MRRANLKTPTIQATDLFCGAGGASTAFRRACDTLNLRNSLLAINHWQKAIDTHQLNHPDVRHLCQSIDKVDPRVEVPNGKLHLLIAAPECTHHSTARGGRPKNDQSRAQPWLILKWLQELYVENLLIENVPEFMTWGPLSKKGKAIKSRKGQTFKAFIDAIVSLGYSVDYRVLNAADYGDPTTRRRLFIIAKRGKVSITWPVPTHSKEGGRTLFGQTKKWEAARNVIDWSIPGKSIFERKKPLSQKTMARIIAGLERFGGEELKPFIIVLRNHADAKSLDTPLPTIAAQGQHVGLVEPFVIPVTHAGGEDRTHDIQQPLPTITGAHRGELAIVEPFVLQQQSGGAPRKVDDPLPTIATDGAQMLVEASLEAFIVGYHSEKDGEKRRVSDVDEPLPTLTTENRFAVVEPFLIPHYGERPGQAPRTHSVDEPVPTIPASGDGKFEVVQPFIASYYGTKNISPVSLPLPTVTTKDRFALVAPVVNGKKLDIRLRMLKPHELAKAMSFGDDYQFTGTQGDKVKQIGNAWPCRLGQALIESILQDYAVVRKPAKRRKVAA